MNFSLLLLASASATVIYASPMANHTETPGHLKIATIVSAPFLYPLHENKTAKGFVIDMLDHMAQQLNFTYELVYTERYGQQNEQGEWNGLIGEVVSHRADLAAAPLTISSNRETAVDFTLGFMQTGLGLLFKKPKSGEKMPFHGFKEMVANDKFVYGCIRNGHTHAFLKKNKFSLFKEMGEILERHPDRFVSSVHEAVERVRNESYVFLGENDMLKYYVRQKPCDLFNIPYPLQTITYGLAFPPSCPYRDLFSMQILDMKETGLLHKLEEKWFPNDCVKAKMCVCQKPKSAEDSASHENNHD